MTQPKIKTQNRRGTPNPPVAIQEILIDHYLQEKRLCEEIRRLDRNDPLRTKLFGEVYAVAHAAHKKYLEAGFLKPDYKNKLQLGSYADKLYKTRGSMLELGCGNGHLLKVMKDLGWNYTGVDIDTKYVLDEVKANVKQADILFYKDQNKYDLIVIEQVLEHILSQDCIYFLSNLYGMLKEGGYLVSCTPNRLNGPHDVSGWFLPLGAKAEGTHFNEMTLAEVILAMKEAGFKKFLTPSLPFTQKLPAGLNSLNFWTKRKIGFARLFERIYPHLPNRVKPTRYFPAFVPDTVAAQKQ